MECPDPRLRIKLVVSGVKRGPRGGVADQDGGLVLGLGGPQPPLGVVSNCFHKTNGVLAPESSSFRGQTLLGEETSWEEDVRCVEQHPCTAGELLFHSFGFFELLIEQCGKCHNLIFR